MITNSTRKAADYIHGMTSPMYVYELPEDNGKIDVQFDTYTNRQWLYRKERKPITVIQPGLSQDRIMTMIELARS